VTRLSLEQARREIDASPPGPEIGAFFDLDGTLIRGFTASVFVRDHLRIKGFDRNDLARTLRLAREAFVRGVDFVEWIRASGEALAGRTDAALRAQAERLFADEIATRLLEDMRDLVRRHQARAHRVVLASSSTQYQAEPMAKELGIDLVLCNRLIIGADGRLTGAFEEPIVWGPGKARAARRLAAELGVDLARSWFYADGNEDEALMHLVGRPRPVHPGPRLAAVARRRGWPILAPERPPRRRRPDPPER